MVNPLCILVGYLQQDTTYGLLVRSTLCEHTELRPIKCLYLSIAYDYENLLLN